ncbi:hypothetical protein C8Q76DRAFT_299777 [Earliella scabrosa]|nr:hypothetical protein C8Q76DRAFT_299777 [Earliella scabrosa]
MFLFRAVFIIGFVSVTFVAQASAWLLPLSRYMLDVVPENADNVDAHGDLVAVSELAGSAASSTDVPVAAETSPIVDGQLEDDVPPEPSPIPDLEGGDAEAASVAVASSTTPTSLARVSLKDANAASHVGGLSVTTTLVGSIVAGILLAA